LIHEKIAPMVHSSFSLGLIFFVTRSCHAKLLGLERGFNEGIGLQGELSALKGVGKSGLRVSAYRLVFSGCYPFDLHCSRGDLD
jgi:hypothetical protein